MWKRDSSHLLTMEMCAYGQYSVREWYRYKEMHICTVVWGESTQLRACQLVPCSRSSHLQAKSGEHYSPQKAKLRAKFITRRPLFFPPRNSVLPTNTTIYFWRTCAKKTRSIPGIAVAGIKAERSPSTSYVLLCRLEAGGGEGLRWCLFLYVECVIREGKRQKN